MLPDARRVPVRRLRGQLTSRKKETEMKDESMSLVAEMAIELLRDESPSALNIWCLLDELDDTAPATANELLYLIHDLVADPRIDLVPGDDTISFAWVGQQGSISSTMLKFWQARDRRSIDQPSL
jgi:hypothetical protein